MIHLGLDAVCWRAALVTGLLDLGGVVAEAADLGAVHLQLNLGTLEFASDPRPAAVGRLIRDHGLEVRVTGAPLARQAHDDGPGAVLGQVERDLDAAAALGSRSLMVYLGRYRPELLAEPGGLRYEADHLRELLSRAGPAAADRGIRLELENASDFTSAELTEIVADVGSAHLGVFLDLTNPYNVLEDPIDAVRRLAPLAVAGHVKDFVLDSVYTPDRYHRLGFSLLFRLPGEGVSNVEGQVAVLGREVADRDFHLAIEGLHTDLGQPRMKERLRASLDFLRRHTA